MHLQKKEDLVYGDINERRAMEIICSHFRIDSLKKLDKFHHMDYESDVAYFEVKSRRFNHNRYPTTMIGNDKLCCANTVHKDVYFVFMFMDGTYYYKYNREDSLETSMGGRRDRGKDEIRPYVFIPIKQLIRML